MTDWMTTASLALGCAVVLHIGWRALGDRPLHPLPPGPTGLPWLGNVIGIDTEAPWKTYAEWAKTYGDIVYSRLLGRDIIIINSEKIANDLLEHRSRNYSDRPYLLTVEMVGMDFNSSLMSYGDRWRSHRRFFHQTFRLGVANRFLPLHHNKACHFIRKLLKSPEQLDDHVFECMASVILNSVYDYDPLSHDDELLRMVGSVLRVIIPALRPDVAVVGSVFPFLLHLPSWVPGMSFKTQMATARDLSKQYLERSFEYSLQKLPTDGPSPSMINDALQLMERQGVAREGPWIKALKEASGTAFLGASETSHSVLMTFFLMMVLNPSVQKKAQQQIDAVVGRTRLPTMDDRCSLPILDAILWETLRYNPVGPLSLPHAPVDDDVYCGFYIPKGAIILVNVWSIVHDESRYTNPDAFMPERFLNEDGSLKSNIGIEDVVFGFGRRICPGRHFAITFVWNVIAKVLAVFDLLKPLDENGVELPVNVKFSGDLSVRPLPFNCRIVPRSPEMDAMKLEELIAASTV